MEHTTWSTSQGRGWEGPGGLLSCHFLPKFEMISKYIILGLPWWLSGKEPTCGAGDTGLVPGPGISHMPQSIYACVPQLPSLCSRAQEPRPLSPWAVEAAAVRSPCTTTRK